MGNKYYKHPTYGFVKGEEHATPVGRLCWPHLVKPKEAMEAPEGKDKAAPRYEIALLLDKADPKVADWLKLITLMTDEMLVLFNQGKPTVLGLKELRVKDGDEEKIDKEKYPYYKGMWVVIAKNPAVTPCYNAKKEEITPAEVKGGQLGKLVVVPIITGWGVSFQLRGTQVIKDDGTKFGGEIRTASSFLDVCEGESEENSSLEEAADKALSTEPQEPAPVGEIPANAPSPEAIRAQMAAKVGSKGKKAALDRL